MARPIVLILHLFRLVDAIYFRKDYSPPLVRHLDLTLCRFDEEKRRAIGEEIAKLSAAGFIKEIYHLEWLANPVLV